MEQITDQEILMNYLSRSETAISMTKRKYGKLILSVAHRILYDARDAEECENDTYMGIWNSIPPVYPENFKAYCLKIARNLALKKLEYYSAEKRDRHKTISYEEINKELGEIRDNDDFTESKLTEIINYFLEQLNLRDRNIFVLRYWYMWSVKEIAKNYNLSESNVKIILFRARSQLKEMINERGYFK